MSSSQPQIRHNNRNTRRPATIAELAELALDKPWEEGQELKYYLRTADRCSRNAKDSVKCGELEAAFVDFVRAATLVLEKLPSHRDYQTVLTAPQRHNLSLNGQDILDNLSDLKTKLVERHERWLRDNPGAEDIDYHDNRAQQQDEEAARRAQAEQDRRVKAEIDDQRRRREEQSRQEADNRARAVASAAAARVPQSSASSQDYTFSRPQQQQQQQQWQDPAFDYDRMNQQLNLNASDSHQKQQEEMRAREQEIVRRRAEEKRRGEQAGIIQRQQEADNAARAVRQNFVQDPGAPSSSHYRPSASIQYPSASSLRAPKAVPSRPPSFLEHFPSASNDTSLLMPLESPTRYEGDSTDSEAPSRHDWRRAVKHRQEPHRTPTRAPARSPSYPPPITTTSPPPNDPRILYPQLMTQHQMTQGYVPSLHSMFMPHPSTNSAPSLLFESNARTPNAAQANGSRSLYGSELLPSPSVPVPQVPSPPVPNRYWPPDPSLEPPQGRQWRPAPFVPSTALAPASAPAPAAPVSTPQKAQRDSDRIIRTSSAVARANSLVDLKTVNLPRESLPRFLAIAKVNTALNRETCGLLLGKDKGHKYVVTTLLIPKQHSTSDTCAMDEEELVMQFTEERGLITLGWIHTHPSQSCFMSSVDLHTHASFQQMLPESFAVVCAPNSNPNFGIFRLTDPPGLKTVLECTVKDAFHPHPELPIYTDADKGHVQMKDSSLEIVDLR